MFMPVSRVEIQVLSLAAPLRMARKMQRETSRIKNLSSMTAGTN
jgi:hypothetical protein